MEIQWLHEVSLENLKFGIKADNLIATIGRGGNVPLGFVLSGDVVEKLANKTPDEKYIDILNSLFQELLDSSCTGKVIVRSSSIYEGAQQARFSGLFVSSLNVSSLKSLLDAISETYHSAKSPSLVSYFKKNNIHPLPEHMGIIVQEQIDYDVGGVAHISQNVVRCEFASNNLEEMISGVVAPSIVAVLARGNNEECLSYKIENGAEGVGKIHEHFPLIFNSFQRLLSSTGDAITIEFCIKKNELFILQVNYSSAPEEKSEFIQRDKQERKWLPLENIGELGLKGAAMHFFAREGMFNKSLLLFPHNTEYGEIYKVARKTFTPDIPLTVRFSYAQCLGLPRSFSPTLSDALVYTKDNKASKWSVIMHASMKVSSSFELLVEEGSATLEHVPGMWESDNKASPDVIRFLKKEVVYYRYKSERLCKFSDHSGSYTKNIRRVPTDVFKRWEKRIVPVINLIRNKFADSLPVNIHFVEEEKGGWQFLNLRKGSGFEKQEHIAQDIPIISCVKDLDKWDGESPIRLRLTMMRGREASLINIANKISISPNPVYVDFGVLSHPAMVLREYGVRVVPSYLLHETNSNVSEYDVISSQKDVGYAPQLRIETETQVVKSNDYYVVRDVEPICPNHLLLLSKHRVPSLADDPGAKKLPELLKGISSLINVREWFLLERGRASFCTSGFTCNHAHAHFVPKTFFKDDLLLMLVSGGDPVRYPDLSSALHEASLRQDEYLLFGSEEDGYFLEIPSPRVSRKRRLIRNILEERRKCL